MCGRNIGIKEVLFSANYANAAVDEKQFIYHGDAGKGVYEKNKNGAVIWSSHVPSLALWRNFNVSAHLLIISTAAEEL